MVEREVFFSAAPRYRSSQGSAPSAGVCPSVVLLIPNIFCFLLAQYAPHPRLPIACYQALRLPALSWADDGLSQIANQTITLLKSLWLCNVLFCSQLLPWYSAIMAIRG